MVAIRAADQWSLKMADDLWLDGRRWAVIEPHLPKNQRGGWTIDRC
jgi:hypothetical protein